jgi:glycosyltransferase involved in cell wall biosynthesis
LIGNRELLAAPAEPVELASKIYRLLSDTELRTAAGLALQRRVADSYSLREMVEATERLYLELK